MVERSLNFVDSSQTEMRVNHRGVYSLLNYEIQSNNTNSVELRCLGGRGGI
jgi:hypothetical protein